MTGGKCILYSNLLDMLVYKGGWKSNWKRIIKLWHAAIYISHPPDVRRVNENEVCSDQQGIGRKTILWLSIGQVRKSDTVRRLTFVLPKISLVLLIFSVTLWISTEDSRANPSWLFWAHPVGFPTARVT